jgi:hypothetical protein
MGSFKGIGESASVDGRYIQRIVVYLESREDYEVYCQRWFPEHGEWLEFRSADGCECSGGCTQVVNLVERDRTKEIVAFGLLDRDALLRELKWEAFWERDDVKFGSMRPCGEHIRFLCRWEMENYLLDPEELEKIITDCPKSMKEPRKLRDISETLKELLSHCEVLIPFTAANILLHEHGEKALDHGFQLNASDRRYMTREVKEAVSRRNLPADIESKLDQYIQKVEAFAEEHPNGSLARWKSLNRMIDGKRFLKQFLNSYKLKDEYRYILARNIKEKDRIPDEIKQLIDWLKQRHSES